ncbi:MAG: LysR family transcriptional regulator [Anaerolineae bacterium]|nr:LysR family transcriptional regulator [Anaerolineae bacterium]
MKAKANVWIEKDGQVVLSTWRVKLLEAIAETGSISGAATKMNISYRRAWEKIQESEARLGQKLVSAQAGGSGGGGSQLTDVAEDYVHRFREFTAGLDQEIAQRFAEFFAEADPVH